MLLIRELGWGSRTSVAIGKSTEPEEEVVFVIEKEANLRNTLWGHFTLFLFLFYGHVIYNKLGLKMLLGCWFQGRTKTVEIINWMAFMEQNYNKWKFPSSMAQFLIYHSEGDWWNINDFVICFIVWGVYFGDQWVEIKLIELLPSSILIFFSLGTIHHQRNNPIREHGNLIWELNFQLSFNRFGFLPRGIDSWFVFVRFPTLTRFPDR